MKCQPGKFILFIIISVFNYAVTNCQNQNNNWYFGDHAGLEFINGAPKALSDGVSLFAEGSACISDGIGKLLFFTDGISVWNRNKSKMPNGNQLKGHFSSTQSALIIPNPDNCNIYYIFTCPAQDSTGPLCYSIVDMSLDGGLGDVATKNIVLRTGVAERLSATLHANGKDYWVVGQEYKNITNGYFAYKDTPSGVNPIPIVSNAGQFRSTSNDVIGYLKFSTGGNKICYTSLYSNPEITELLDFDNTSGKVSNPINLQVSGYGVEFSPDDSKLYIATANAPFTIYQFDISSSDSIQIRNSKKFIFQTNISNPQYGGALLLGPDKRIYVNRLQKNYLGIINNPNESGPACNYIDSALNLNGFKCQDGLPNFIKTYSSNCGIITSANSNSIDNQAIKLFPNPMKDYSILQLPNNSHRKFTLKIFTSDGRLIRSTGEFSGNSYKISRSSLTSGVYIIRIFEKNKPISNVTFIAE